MGLGETDYGKPKLIISIMEFNTEILVFRQTQQFCFPLHMCLGNTSALSNEHSLSVLAKSSIFFLSEILDNS